MEIDYNEVVPGCLLKKRGKDCKDAKYDWCARCGWNIDEAKRREKLPIIIGIDGLGRKHV